jgi:DHA3 family macrolide efflux protein-like MFS transporter
MERWKVRFFTVWIGQGFSLITSELVQFALIWWLTDSTGSGTVLGIATMIALLPQAIGGLFVGALIDRWNRRLVMMASDAVVALASLGLAYLFLTDTAQLWHVYVIILIRAIGQTFHTPAMLASTSLMVPPAHLTRIAGLNQMVLGFVMIVAPPLGALLMGLLPLQGIMMIDVSGVIMAILPLLFIMIPQPPTTASANLDLRAVAHDVTDGLHYLRNWPGAIGMLLISTSINFLSRPAFQLVAILVADHFAGDERDFALMGAAMGTGVMAGGILVSTWGGFERRMETSLWGILGMGAAILVIGLTPSSAFAVAVGAMFMGGMMMPVCISPIQALVQCSVEPAMQGRIFTFMQSVSTLVSPISLALAGILFDNLIPQAWYIGAGIAALIIGVIGFRTPRVLNLGAQHHYVYRAEEVLSH